MLDLKTVFILWIAQACTAAVMFFIAWWHKPQHRFYLFWSLGFLSHACGVVLMLGRNIIPDFISIEIANAISLCAFFFWINGLRQCDLRPVTLAGFIPLLIWSCVVAIPAINATLAYRVGTYAISASSGYVVLAITAFHAQFSSRGPRTALACVWLALACNSLTLAVLTLMEMPVDFMRLTIGPVYGMIAMTCFLMTMLIGSKIVMDRSEFRLRELAARDPLTGAFNRRGVADALDKLRQRPADAPELALLLFDIDHFKKINDTYGHQAGDAVLVVFSRICAAILKPGAVFGRSGGEEFCAVVPVSSSEETLALAKRILDRIATSPIPTDRGVIAVTTSLGIASCPAQEFDFDRLMTRADKALYLAKAEGRNRAVSEDGRSVLGYEPSAEATADRQVAQLRQISAA